MIRNRCFKDIADQRVSEALVSIDDEGDRADYRDELQEHLDRMTNRGAVLVRMWKIDRVLKSDVTRGMCSFVIVEYGCGD